MAAVKLADAKARLSELVDRAQAGDTIEITRHGKAVAKLTPATLPRKPIDISELAAVTTAMPKSDVNAAQVVRSLRDGDRY